MKSEVLARIYFLFLFPIFHFCILVCICWHFFLFLFPFFLFLFPFLFLHSMPFTMQRSGADLNYDHIHSFLLVLLITQLGVITGHGICSCGRCVCQEGWFGKLCQYSRKCNMTEEESRSLCESADGVLCSGKGKDWQLIYSTAVPLQKKWSDSGRLMCMKLGCCLVTLSKARVIKRIYIWLCHALTSILSNTHCSHTCLMALMFYAVC